MTWGSWLACDDGLQPKPIYLTQPDQIVGAGLPAMTASQPAPIYLTPRDQTVGAGLLAKAA
ncbi:hypothetical protein FJ692_00520 [Pseudomonas fluorescens]|nr:hypothetical protein C1751_14120 [Pseudomonas fluorescens]TPV61670.1 hypothetical protein FJ692_00520 [Pseudomonas fluorescens]